MKRNSLNFWVDVLALLALIGLVITGTVMWRHLPPGYKGGHGITLWGWDRHDFGALHLWLGAAFMVLVALHLILHWAWVCTTTARFFGTEAGRRRQRFIAGLVFIIILAILIIGGLLWMKSQVRRPDSDYRGPGWRHVN
ncbi:MAG: DUF4405 domain-containing protein [Sedimentisphaerales bacterium]|nr:DUF4405 domain-containing protein [Sedimentisphaerales bacterium]